VVKIVYNDCMSTTTIPPPPINPTLADLRNHARLTTRQVGEAMRLSHARIVQIEAIGTDSIEQLEQLGTVYGVSEDKMSHANKRTKNR